MEDGLGARRGGLRQLRVRLRPGCLELGLGTVQRRLADVLLLQQLLLLQILRIQEIQGFLYFSRLVQFVQIIIFLLLLEFVMC